MGLLKSKKHFNLHSRTDDILRIEYFIRDSRLFTAKAALRKHTKIKEKLLDLMDLIPDDGRKWDKIRANLFMYKRQLQHIATKCKYCN